MNWKASKEVVVDQSEELSQYLPRWTKETTTTCHDGSCSRSD